MTSALELHFSSPKWTQLLSKEVLQDKEVRLALFQSLKGAAVGHGVGATAGATARKLRCEAMASWGRIIIAAGSESAAACARCSS